MKTAQQLVSITYMYTECGEIDISNSFDIMSSIIFTRKFTNYSGDNHSNIFAQYQLNKLMIRVGYKRARILFS